MAEYKVSLKKIIEELSLESIYTPKEPEEIFISSRDTNRPGLELTGYMDYHNKDRILLFGNAEYSFLSQFDSKKRFERIEGVFSKEPPAVIFARSLHPFAEVIECAEKYSIPILKTQERTSTLMSSLVTFLNTELARRVTKHGVLMEVYGEGIMIIGDSGVGKSETAIELINRGHRLVADDAVEIRKLSERQLIGTSPENIRHFIELRGIGIINAMRIFGSGAIKMSQSIDIVINLEFWDKARVYDRMGLESEVTDILGVKVPIITIPVTPGRNLAVIIEVAVMNQRQKKMGYNAAEQLLNNLGMGYDVSKSPRERTYIW
ncbi:MAG: HPr(Ser) kinase/phosphatase [Clostridia bacterium]|nr:HPr(Ser) kinase/phosphatase [Clostridia bacterium]